MAKRQIRVEYTLPLLWILYDEETGLEFQVAHADDTMEIIDLVSNLVPYFPGRRTYPQAAEYARKFLNKSDGEILEVYDVWGDYPEVFGLNPADLEAGRYMG